MSGSPHRILSILGGLLLAGFPARGDEAVDQAIAGLGDRRPVLGIVHCPGTVGNASDVLKMLPQRLGARKIGTVQVPVLFEAPQATGLVGHFVSAASGGSLYRKASFLVNVFLPLSPGDF